MGKCGEGEYGGFCGGFCGSGFCGEMWGILWVGDFVRKCGGLCGELGGGVVGKWGDFVGGGFCGEMWEILWGNVGDFEFCNVNMYKRMYMSWYSYPAAILDTLVVSRIDPCHIQY